MSLIGSMRAARPRSSPSVWAPRSKQLGHHGQLGLVDAEPVVEQVAVLVDAAVALDHATRRRRAAAPSRASDDGSSSSCICGKRLLFWLQPLTSELTRQRVVLGRGLGLLGQHAGDAPLDCVPAAASGERRRLRVVRSWDILAVVMEAFSVAGPWPRTRVTPTRAVPIIGSYGIISRKGAKRKVSKSEDMAV